MSHLWARIRHHTKQAIMRYRNRWLDYSYRRRLKPLDTFIASYPRSGNTWLLFLIADIMLQKHGFETDTVLPVDYTRLIAPTYQQIDEIDSRFRLPFRVIKTHPVHDFLSKHRVVYLFRLPADVLVSYYHYHLRPEHPEREQVIGMTPGEFAINHLNDWCDHITSAIQMEEAGKHDMLFITYEALVGSPVQVLEQVCNFLGLEVTDTMLEIAVANHEFEKEKHAKADAEIRQGFFRKGRINSAQDDLDDSTLALINDKALPLYEKAARFTL